MEDQTFWKIRRWVLFFAISLGFSIQNGHTENLNPNPTYSCPINNGGGDVTFTFNCIDGEPGDTICIPVTVTNFTNIVIAQFEILWNSDVLHYIGVTNPGTPNLNVNSDFNLSGPNALRFIPLNFDPFNGETLPDGATPSRRAPRRSRGRD